ncbi:hypothetical protein TCAL_15861 [Tigriopus californicus]|uniref:OTU domain-containing protein n=1 Tax=Tigriopus californicus TaxID=6832 RepID=A0A553NQP5_TIGCA|nr:uncharacterized protein LOC131878871 [Tigriopus californicus]TRY67755.1 hypothetical protein TCAL_15861 [Tigriopus californicus]
MTSSSIFDSVYGGYHSPYSSSTTPSRYDSFMDRPSYTPSYRTTYSSSYNRIPSSTYGIPSATSSVYDKYYNYLDDLTNVTRASRLGNGGGSTASSGLGYTYMPRHLMLSDLISNDELDEKPKKASSGISRTIPITVAPKHDKYGKELSNYDRWKLRNNEEPTSPSSTTSSISSQVSREDEPLSDKPRRGRFTSRFISREEPAVREREASVTPTLTSPTPKAYSKEDEIFPTLHSSRYGQRQRSASVRPTSSTSRSSLYSGGGHSFPTGAREKLTGYDVQDVKGDGGCYYRCLSLYFTGSEDNYMKYRRDVMAYIRQNLDNYSSMIRSEIGRSSTNDYFSRKTRADRQDWAETTEIIATCCAFDINVHVLALVPGKRVWEWLHFDPSIGTGKPSYANRDVYLYNQGSVHFMLCTPK